MSTVISVEHLSKCYRLGAIGGATLRADVSRWLARLRGRSDPNLKIGQEEHSRLEGQEFWALRDVSFEVKQGEILGIIGRNGAGKSTLLKILSRVTAPTGGAVKVKGRIASLLEVGTGFHPELTGRENIFLNGAILGMTKAEIRKKFDEIVDFSGVEDFIDTPVKRYSSGMYVRLAFAVAAHLEPEILIVDEVLAVGDADFQKKCMGKMQDVAGHGRTVLFVSHNMPAVQQLCGRCLLLRMGIVAMEGTCRDVTANYLAGASANHHGLVDLRSHVARSASSRPVISEVAIRDSDERVISQVFPHQKVFFDVVVSAGETIREPRLAFAIEDSYGRRLMTMASFFNQNPLPSINHTGAFRCECESLSLAPGRYLLSVSIGTKSLGLIDSLDGAIWFETIWNNDFKNGENYLPVYGPCLKQSKWSLIR